MRNNKGLSDDQKKARIFKDHRSARVFGNDEGLEELWSILVEAGYFEVSFKGNSTDAFNLGKRDLADKILKRVMRGDHKIMNRLMDKLANQHKEIANGATG